jgi:hypothetical protein
LPEAECSLALLTPGLCGPALGVPPQGYPEARPVALEKLLSRARRDTHAAADADACLCALFDPAAGVAGDGPVGALSWLADTGRPAAGYVMRADPVHLRADQACLRLFDSTSFSLAPDEAQALVAAFNAHYADRGWRLEAPVPQRWYLAMDAAPEIATVSPLQMAGRDINTGLPGGDDRLQWHALLNEVQMLFHAHPVNAARAERGEPAINSIWPWGGGYLPAVADTAIRQVFADRPVARGLAQHHGISRQAPPESGTALAGLLASGLNLLVLDALEKPARYADVDSWAKELQRMEHAWFRPVLELLRCGRIAALAIYPVNGKRYAISRHRLKYFWMRGRTLQASCHAG